jgi:hypothetical protein
LISVGGFPDFSGADANCRSQLQTCELRTAGGCASPFSSINFFVDTANTEKKIMAK